MKSLQKYNGDAVDRANYRLTSAVLGIFTALIAAKQHFGKPIQCWFEDANATTTDASFENYVEKYCFLGNMYTADFSESLPLPEETRRERMVFFYEWVPFILLAQIGLFMVPNLMWKMFGEGRCHDPVIMLIHQLVSKGSKGSKGSVGSNGSVGSKKYHGTGASRMVKTNHTHKYRHRVSSAPSTAHDATGTPPTTTMTTPSLPNVSKGTSQRSTLGSHMTALRAMSLSNMKNPSLRRSLTRFYLVFKVLQLANSLFQLFALNKFLGPEYKLWGCGILKDVLEGKKWQHSGKFPMVTNCDVDLRNPDDGTFYQRTFQCVLLINMIIEKCLIFIWLWLLLLSVVNLASLIKWIHYATSKSSSRRFIAIQLACGTTFRGEKIYSLKLGRLRRFVDDYLGLDGVITLRLIKANSNPFMIVPVVDELWRCFDDGTDNPGNEPKEVMAIGTSGDTWKQKDARLPI